MKIKILSYNIHKGFSLTNQNFILPMIKKSIQEVHADIVFLQEVQGEHFSHKLKWVEYPNSPQFEYLADTLWPHYSYGQNAVYEKGHHGNAILSKFPIKSTNNLDLTLHRLEQRGLLHAEIIIPELNKTLSLYNTHLNLLHYHRKEQVAKCIQYIKNHSAKEFIWAGDFNDWQERLPSQIEHTLACDEAFHSTLGVHAKTFPCFSPMLPLDRIYLKGFKIIDRRVLRDYPWSQLSDHLAIYCEVEFKS